MLVDNDNTFLAKFGTPFVGDTTPPEITNSHVPAAMTIAATSAAGAQVFFLPPTARDDGHAGVNVTCSHAPNTTFPVGTTTVTCAASDPLGNKSTTSIGPAGDPQPVEFTVTVVDELGPTFTQVPAPITVTPSAGSSSAVVTFTPPLALDLVDGSRPVTCAPASGAEFSVGTTEVTCSAEDARGNLTEVSFGVTVVDVVPPVVTVPEPIATTATSSQGAVVTYTASATDLTSGPLAPACSHPSGSTFPLGTTVVTCSATDPSGNTTTSSFPVTVTYAWSGLLKPLDSDGQVFQNGTKLKIRFRLTDASTGITDAHATLTTVKVETTLATAEGRALSDDAISEAMPFRYNPSKGWYEYVLATKSMASGEWDLLVHLGDGVAHSVRIRLWR